MTYTRLLYNTGRPYLQGSDIRAVQQALIKAGFDSGPVDGVYGTKTAKAVRAFQKAKVQKADGIVGPQTWGALFETSLKPQEPVRTIRRGDMGDNDGAATIDKPAKLSHLAGFK